MSRGNPTTITYVLDRLQKAGALTKRRGHIGIIQYEPTEKEVQATITPKEDKASTRWDHLRF
jgi:DNA-binding PadR family transcriptional regulator